MQKARMKGEFLRRLLLLIANGDVTYSLKDNDIENQCPWPFPLASILAHGQRLLIILEDMKAEPHSSLKCNPCYIFLKGLERRKPSEGFSGCRIII